MLLITVKLVCNDHSVNLNINPQAKLDKLFKSYYELRGSVLFTFSYQDCNLDPNKTAADYNIKNKTVINVIRH